MAEILVIANNKGGVSKTTTAVCLAAYFSSKKKRVLLLDADPQCNLTAALINVDFGGARFLPLHPEIEDRFDIADLMASRDLAPYPTSLPYVSLIPNKPSNIELDQTCSEEQVQNFLSFFDEEGVHEMFDVIIIDTPPAKGVLTTASIRASTAVLIPVVMERKGVEGLLGMIQKVEEAQDLQPPHKKTRIIGILPSKFDARMRLHRTYLDSLNNPETMGVISDLMVPTLLDQGSLSSFVIKERAAIKEMELADAVPNTPFLMPARSDVRKEWTALGKYVQKQLGV